MLYFSIHCETQNYDYIIELQSGGNSVKMLFERPKLISTYFLNNFEWSY